MRTSFFKLLITFLIDQTIKLDLPSLTKQFPEIITSRFTKLRKTKTNFIHNLTTYLIKNLRHAEESYVRNGKHVFQQFALFLLTQGLYAEFMQLICFYVKKFHIIQECESSNFIILYIYTACSHFFTCFFMWYRAHKKKIYGKYAIQGKQFYALFL